MDGLTLACPSIFFLRYSLLRYLLFACAGLVSVGRCVTFAACGGFFCRLSLSPYILRLSLYVFSLSLYILSLSLKFWGGANEKRGGQQTWPPPALGFYCFNSRELWCVSALQVPCCLQHFAAEQVGDGVVGGEVVVDCFERLDAVTVA